MHSISPFQNFLFSVILNPITYILLFAAVVVGLSFLFPWLYRRRSSVKRDRETLQRYRQVIGEYDRWMAGLPQIVRVLENLRAEAEGEALNGGTPHGNENCIVAGLREQLLQIRKEEIFKARFQERVLPWLLECLGPAVVADTAGRNHRFLEKALELVQACGCTQVEAHQLVNYVFRRPVGEKIQETGGVMLTLAALCHAQKIDMHQAGERELDRVWLLIDQIRAKEATKPKYSPLPGGVKADVVDLYSGR